MKQLLCCIIILLMFAYLGIYNGNLALWEKEEAYPSQVFPRSVLIFPPQDQAALEKGIPFFDEAQRNRLLEDYGS